MLSIILPIYNVEKYLPNCIKSILAQTYRNFELILVDDGSPDNCPKICDEYALRDSRIKVIHQKNSGVSAARNAGLVIAKGEYIGFVDPDDWIASDMYESMISAMHHEKADFATCGYDYYFEDGSLDVKRKYKESPNETITHKELMKRFSDMPPSVRHGVVNKLFKSELLKDIRFNEKLHSSEDVFFLCDYVKNISKAVVLHKPLYCNLIRSGSATHGGLKIDSLADSFAAHDRMYQDIVKCYPDLKNHSLAFLLDVCTLKYKEAKRKAELLPLEEQKTAEQRLKMMRKYVKRQALQAIFDSEIYWKTRICYLILR